MHFLFVLSISGDGKLQRVIHTFKLVLAAVLFLLPTLIALAAIAVCTIAVIAG